MKITTSNFQEMHLRDSTLQRQQKLDFDLHNHKVPFVISWLICKKKKSEYDQEIPQSQTAVKPMAPRGRATQQSRATGKTN